MSAHTPPAPRSEAPPAAYDDTGRGGGWILFAGLMLVFVGIMNLIDGIAAASTSNFYVGNAHFVFSDLKTWGWIILILGAGQLFTGFGVFANSRIAAWLGIGFASLNAIAQLLFLPSYPFLALALFTLDLLIIYGLTVYGGRMAD